MQFSDRIQVTSCNMSLICYVAAYIIISSESIMLDLTLVRSEWYYGSNRPNGEETGDLCRYHTTASSVSFSISVNAARIRFQFQ